MRTLVLLAFVAATLASRLNGADAPQGTAEALARRDADLKQFITRCDRYPVVVFAKEERKGGQIIFTCKEILKAMGQSPIVGEVFVFPVEGAKASAEAHEVILFLLRVPPGRGFLSHRLVDGRYGALSIADLKNALQAKKE